MLSATVKEELKKQLPGVMIMDRFGSSESGAQGAVEDGASGPRFVMSDDTIGARRRIGPPAPRGTEGSAGWPGPGGSPSATTRTARRRRPPSRWTARGVRWSIPGDLASVEPDGTITVHGRGSASINSGGEKIFPEEVEAAVKTHPEVFDAIVVGLPDERFGERVAVVVQPTEPGQPAGPRGHPGPLPRPHRRLQDPPSVAGGGRDPTDGSGKARCQGGKGPLLTVRRVGRASAPASPLTPPRSPRSPRSLLSHLSRR